MFGAWSFRHGVHPPDSKTLTESVAVRRMPFPDEIVLPLRQHAGRPAKLIVKKGDHVERGDKVGEADGWISVPIHASAAGTVTEVGWWPHPDGTVDQAVRIKVDPFSPQIPRPRIVPEWEGLSPEEVVAAVQQAVLLDAYVNKCAEVNDVTHRAVQYHSRLQIGHREHVAA